jgi:hypothetical protein
VLSQRRLLPEYLVGRGVSITARRPVAIGGECVADTWWMDATGMDQLRFKAKMTITSLWELPVTWD